MVLTAVGIVNLSGCAPVSDYEDRDAGAGGTDSEGGLDASFPEQDTAQDTSEWETDSETTEQEIWWPAHIITFEGGEEILHNVSLKFNDTGLEIWEMEGGYPSEESIPEELKEENGEVLRSVLDYSKFFFEDDAYTSILPNNIFLVVSGTDYGGKFLNGAFGFRMESTEEGYTANCFEACPEYQMLALKSSGGNVVFHELLHDAWHSYLSQEQRVNFAQKARLFFNVLGDTWQDDQLVGAIWHGQYHNPENPDELLNLPFEGELEGSELDNWAEENLSAEIDETEKERIKNMLKAYFRMHSTMMFGRTYGMSKAGRNGFDDTEMSQEEAEQEAQENTGGYIVKEGFTFMCANYPVLNDLLEHPYSTKPNLMPSFMVSSYYGVVKGEHLNNLNVPGYGYFTSESNFEDFSQYIVDFANWMREEYPELNEITP